MGIGYSIDPEPDPDVTAKALGREIAMKPRDAIEVCEQIKGKALDEAHDYLEAVQVKEQAVPLRKHNDKASHQKETGPGRYPVKVASEIQDIISQAEANAEYKGLDTDEMRLIHAACQRAGEIEGRQPRARGRATAWNQSLCHIEIVLEEERE
jgi:large subunit ribosomal protein L22